MGKSTVDQSSEFQDSGMTLITDVKSDKYLKQAKPLAKKTTKKS
jgi:hypothetical protein